MTDTTGKPPRPNVATPLTIRAAREIDPKAGWFTRGIALRKELGLVLPEELAAALLITPETLAQWRGKKQGPAATRLGKGVFYRQVDIDWWITNANNGVTSEGN